MDDTHLSRASDTAATRKRRSSILKSQRPPRTPFTELEFHVATPTDTSKSRRVSFSKRTGVAEFATNEATTTWKNFYEEHNKSLELSNDSGSKQPVSHLGKRIFDQQFEEVEADFIGIHNTGPIINASSSLNNFEHQLASLECTDDIKLTAPQNKFDFSAFTNNHTKLFDELAIPCGEVTDRIDLNFSTVQHIGGNDDLDEIQNDLKQNFGHGAFKRKNTSEYIEVDLNMTQVVKNDDDMSIRDTVHSPKVRDLSKNGSVHAEMAERIGINLSAVQTIGERDDLDEIQKDLQQKFGHAPFEKQNISEFIDLNMSRHAEYDTQSLKVQDISKKCASKNINKDWVEDKENNPYAVLRETENFTINEEPDKVLVFDGKRLTVQSEIVDYENCRQTLLPPEKAPQRKTIVLNINDDLPNFVDDSHTAHTSGFIDVAKLKKSIVIDDMSITEPFEDIKKRTILYDDVLGNISVTQAVPSNIVIPEHKKQTVLYEEDTGNISVTEALPTNIITEKRRTIVYNNDDGNMSITRALSTNLVKENKTNIKQNDRRKTIVFDDGNMSMTQAIPANILPEKTTKRRTIVFEDNAGNLSITQAVPNILITEAKAEKRRTIVYEDETGNISVTQAIPSNILIAENAADRRRTVVFESDTGNISVTQAVPSSLILQKQVNDMNVSETKMVPAQILTENSRRRTIVYENDTGDLSITQAVPNHVIQGISTQNQISHDAKMPDCGFAKVESERKTSAVNNETNKRRTIVFDNDDADISVTQAVSLNQVICAIRKEQKENQLQADAKENETKTDVMTNDATNKRRTIVFDNDDADISMTQAVPVNAIHCFNKSKAESTNKVVHNSNPFNEGNKHRTVVFENDEGDIPTTLDVNTNQFMPGLAQQNVHDDLEAALNQALHGKNRKSQRTIVYDKENVNISISQTPQDRDVNISISQSLRDNVMENVLKQRTIVIEDSHISMTEALPVNILGKINEIKNIDKSESKDSNVPEIFDVSMTNAEENYLLDTENTDVSTMKQKHQAEIVPRKSLNLEQKSANFITKPIPPILLTNNSENQEKYNKNNKYISTAATASITKGVGDVIIYQAALSKRTEQGDSKFQEQSIQNDDKLSSSSKIAVNEVKQNDENISSSSKITDAIEAKDAKETKSTQEDQESQMNDQNEMTEHNQPEINDDLTQASSDSTSVMSKSILNDLLDMSSASMEGIDDKSLMAQVDEPNKKTGSEYLPVKDANSCNTNSNDTMFFITKDDDEAQIQTEKFDDGLQLTEHSPLPLEYKDEPEMVTDLQNNLENLKEALRDENNSKNRHYEKILSSDLDKYKEFDKSKGSKSFKAANDTNELLEMLSEFTDKTMTRQLDAHLEEDDEQPEPILIKGHLALENKSDGDPEPKRLSFATKRQSIVMSREDLLNNISMAGAALKSRIDFDDSDLEETVGESPVQEKSSKKSVRHSREVVKTLHFDESISEISIHSETKLTPLKKTAFGETSYMQEHKAKVIPDYLKDVSDGIKELMDDLVKPNADVVLPFECLDKATKKVASTCSTQIQANLITSSQVDLNSGLYSNRDSAYDVNVNKISSADMINNAVNRSVSRALKSPIKSILSKSTTATHASEKSFDSKWDSTEAGVPIITPTRHTESPGRVLIFDHNNPLNNILLAPETFTEVHRYNPGQSSETICVSERSDSVQISLNEKDTGCELERVSTQYNVGSMIHSVKQSGDASSGKVAESQSKVSTLSKPMSVDRSTHVKLKEVKDIEMNTLIAMKGNNELLETSSSLTLVDDALARSTFDVDIDTRTTTSQEEMTESPMKVIYKVKGDGMLTEKLDSDLTSNVDLEDRLKPKKRFYSPTKRDKHKHCTMSSLDVTPKPTSKMQKLSDSPDSFKTIDVSHPEERSEMESQPETNTNKKSPRKSKAKKPGTSITVQQLMTEYNVGPIDHETLQEQIKEVLRDPKSDCSSIEPTQTASQSDCASLEMVSSFTSSKNIREDRSSVVMSSPSRKVSRMDWQPELVDQLSSKNLVDECESSVNVVAKIDMLPFMGSHECEWESSGGDTWAFRLLHARLRLAIRLAHRHDNATRTRVRADTPVRAVHLEILRHDSKNTLAALCVSFAAETMRYFINRGCACAGDVPALVRRCAAAARLAARWGRVMCEAKLHLAYTISADSLLTLKVANIPLRSVWEVTMRLELVVEDAREAPWVRAGDVRVRRVLSAAARDAPEPRVARALRHLPRDWSHAPRAVWRVFKYLKHKTRDDDELFIGQ